ncbi:MAG: DUF554 domain-containing protein [Bacteroidales bacterium]|nr:DUF554 domain-containing protein [Bacteroidales bacterium]
MTGTLINVGAVIIGSLTGYIFSKKIPEKIIKLLFQTIGLFTIFLGINMAFKTNHYLVLIFSLVLGAITGELLDVDKYINRMGDYLKRKLKTDNHFFSEGFISAFLLFCMGSMAILGAIEEGMGGKPNLLIAKSLLDGFSSMALASAMGIGVIFSAIPLFLYQGGLTILAKFVGDYSSDILIQELTSAGGIILLAIGFNLLEMTRIKAINILPALIFNVVLVLIFLV